MTTYPNYEQAQALAALRDDDPVACDGCGATVPHSEIAQDYTIARLGAFCEDCAPAMRSCVRLECDVPYRRARL